jgi:hypothetical protein
MVANPVSACGDMDMTGLIALYAIYALIVLIAVVRVGIVRFSRREGR